MADLSRMYTDRAKNFGAAKNGGAHSTRLKNWLFANYLDLQAYKEWRNNLLAFPGDVGPALGNHAMISDIQGS